MAVPAFSAIWGKSAATARVMGPGWITMDEATRNGPPWNTTSTVQQQTRTAQRRTRIPRARHADRRLKRKRRR